MDRFEKYKTPYKLGRPVLTGSGIPGAFDECSVDCPFVFRHNGRFYMMYVGFDGQGYQTALAVSDNLIDWEHHGMIFRRGEGSGWDSVSTAGCWILRDNDLWGPGTLKKWNGRYWLAYHAYPGAGFENGPACIGLAWTEDENLLQWNRLEEPVLRPEDGEAWERGGLYKECLLEVGGLFYMFYNAKTEGKPWIEQTGVAVSADMVHWRRQPDNPLLKVSPSGWDSRFVSDPCVLRDGEQWAMFFFGFDDKHAQEGIALSGNLHDWDKCAEPILKAGAPGEVDSIHAHKPSVIAHNGVLYHFYVAVREYREGDRTIQFGREFRTISVATSAPIE